jgi:hypothetical protein
MLPEGAEEAADALAVERSSSVRRALNEVRVDLVEERIERTQAAAKVVEIVQELGLRAVELDEPPEEIDEDDLGVVCWVAVLD